MITDNDSLARRCPRLGHEVHFSYCRYPGEATPCRGIVDCWRETFDSEGFVRENYDTETLKRLFAPPEDRVTTLLDLIRQARERAARPRGDG